MFHERHVVSPSDENDDGYEDEKEGEADGEEREDIGNVSILVMLFDAIL